MAVIFLFDVSLMVGFVVSVLYIIPVLFSIYSSQRRTLFIVAGISSILTMIAVPFKPSGNFLLALFNRPASLIALWTVVMLLDHFTILRKRAENELMSREERFRGFLTASSDIVYRMSSDWREMRQLRGREFVQDTDDPSDTWLDRYVHPEDRSQVLIDIDRAITTKGTFRSEHRIRRVDGSYGWVLSRAVPVLDDHGNILEWLGTASDMSDRKRADEEQRITVEFLRIVNESNGTRELVQKATSFLKERSGCEAVGVRLQEGVDFPYYETKGFPQHFIEMEGKLCSYDEQGRVEHDENGIPIIECMCGNVIRGRTDPSRPFFTGNGSFWANDTTRLLATTTDGDRRAHTRNRCNGEGYESVALIPLRFGDKHIGLIQFNDHRKGMFTPELIAQWERLAGYMAVALAKLRADEQLRESEGRLRLAQHVASIGTFELNVQTGANLWTPELEAMYGLPPGGFQGTQSAWEKLVHPEDRDGTVRQVSEAIDNGGFEGEWRVIWPDGTVHWLQGRGWVFSDLQGRPLRLLGVNIDITERKRAEEELRRYNDELKQFAYVASHDLQEPLRMVTAYLGLLETKYGKDLDGEAKKYMDFAVEGGLRARELIKLSP